MSAQFKPGDRARLRDGVSPVSGHEDTREFVVEAVSSTGRAISLVGVHGYRGVERFEKVQPEWVVGQQVKDYDYERLPVGSKADNITKTSANGWTDDLGGREEPNGEWFSERTLTHLPDATEPEDEADLYVEPEPLKADQNVLVWARVVDAKPDSDGEVEVSLRRADGYDTSYATTYTLPDAIVRPGAGQVPPWLEVDQAEAKAISAIKTALVVEGGMHDDRYTQQTAESLYRAGIRATKDGAS